MTGGLRIGVVGCGRATEQLHLPALARAAGARAVAVVDPDPRRVAAALRREPSLRVHDDHHALAADPQVDVVAVCVPPALHAEVALAALAAGRHVYLEKPVAVTWDDATAIADAARSAPGTVAMGFNLRSHRLVGEARAILAAGAIGPVELVRTTWTSGYNRGGEWPAWRDRRETGGGAIHEIAIHHLDLCAHLLGEELEITAASSVDREVADQSAVLIGRAAGGALVSISAAQRTADVNEIEVFGRDGALRFSLYRADSLQVRRGSDLAGGPRARLRQGLAAARRLPGALVAARAGGDFLGSYTAHWEATAAALRSGSPPPASLDDGLRALALALAAVESATAPGARL